MSTGTRSDPYRLAFDAEFEKNYFEAIASEAEQRDLNTWEPEQFMLLHAVAEPLRATIANEGASAVEQFGPLLFQGYHYWKQRKPLITVSEPLFRHVLADFPAVGPWEIVAPGAAGYVQFPRNILWARIAEDAQPEAVDGFFYTMGGRVRLDVLVVLGLLPARPGYSVIPLSAELAEPAGHWADETARTNSPDFANNLTGGELRRLHAIETAGEVWKLISRLFWYSAHHPAALDADTRQLRLVNGRG